MSPLDPALLDILVCPETRRPVALADESLVARVNVAARAGALRNRGGEVVAPALEGLLVRDDGQVAYPVRDDIPIMLIDESIDLSALARAGAVDAPTP